MALNVSLSAGTWNVSAASAPGELTAACASAGAASASNAVATPAATVSRRTDLTLSVKANLGVGDDGVEVGHPNGERDGPPPGRWQHDARRGVLGATLAQRNGDRAE